MLQEDLKLKYGSTVPRIKCYRARCIALDMIRGTSEDHYKTIEVLYWCLAGSRSPRRSFSLPLLSKERWYLASRNDPQQAFVLIPEAVESRTSAKERL
ncbi:hypothetical protein NL676_023820 [Syzygium grande]|nr:hypothetical protein NL676_023820 [Syzygium grande]